MRGGVLTVAILLLPLSAEARPARCTTTDDGTYPCDFQPTDRAGSFRISAPGKPTFLLNVEEPGRASAFVNLGPRNVSLPGVYVRSEADPACWESDATRARICMR
ncbi:hypothetical protein D9599_03820 [Roseomonas sp. KE2513]|uniref:hypothetical protein n=1 Tax=Roseomonas sp. KE2513 TaxID=2479202 RepID=UPI0018DF9123|nr:hypothetical protein [Roseomonas sp. KE2513]MBI0534697.1 hypothetical protein [Roseomonas sp. KE2513]